MQVLLKNWLKSNFSDSVVNSGNSSEELYRPENDHSYGDSSINAMYPFIQLILEFANNTLISGVAHVLYSRLLKEGSL